MDAKDFLKEYKRICKVNTLCMFDCPMKDYCRDIWKGNFPDGFKEEMVDIVEKWAKEHPLKTNRMVLKETFGDLIFSSKFPYDSSGVLVNNKTLDIWLDMEYRKPERQERPENKCATCKQNQKAGFEYPCKNCKNHGLWEEE